MVTSLLRNGNDPKKIDCHELRAQTGVLPPGLGLPASPLFGTDGIRGKAGELLTAPFALHLGYWAGQVLKETTVSPGPVLMGQDSRHSSDMLAMAIAAGLTSAGVEVWHLGLCPTPCLAILTQKTEAMGGIMISASHNPPQDNGIKFFGSLGSKLSRPITQQIEARLRGSCSIQNPTHNNWGKISHQTSLVHDYEDFLRQTLPSTLNLAGMRVVLDLAWGAAVHVAPQIFRALGAEVITLHDRPDGDRINVQCGSTHLEPLQQSVLARQADLGFAFDGDADRVIAIDSLGRIVDGDYILYLWGKKLLEQEQLPNTLLIGTVMANLGFERAWQKLGGQLLRTDVGDQHVQSKMWETGAMLGGEQSGHIICHHHSYSGDGVQAALHLATLVQQAGVGLSELIDQSFQTYPQILRNIRVEDRERRLNWQNCSALQLAIAKAEQAMGSSGRVLVRASGTEPLIRVMVESSQAKSAEFWTNHLVRAVEKSLVS
jgi:phosphoglucosamine mutase